MSGDHLVARINFEDREMVLLPEGPLAFFSQEEGLGIKFNAAANGSITSLEAQGMTLFKK